MAVVPASATDTDLLIEGHLVSVPATDTDLLIEGNLGSGPGEDTDTLIEVAVVLRSGGPQDHRRPSRYGHLPALVVAPLKRFCEPAFPVRPSVRQFG